MSENEIDSGGQFHPGEQGHDPDGKWNQTFEWGITRRDWLAGLAMQGLLANPSSAEFGFKPGEIAVYSYQQADALIKEGKK